MNQGLTDLNTAVTALEVLAPQIKTLVSNLQSSTGTVSGDADADVEALAQRIIVVLTALSALLPTASSAT